MVRMPADFEDKHNRYYETTRQEQNRGRILAPGAQYLVHLFRGGYLGDDYKDGRGRKLLDVGCGSGFNAVTMCMLGWDVTGCEINETVVDHARKTVAEYGYDIPVDLGENERLRYEDGSFDFLLSMNVIHYAQSREAMDRTVEEYSRVLKPGGRVLVVTTTQDNWLLKNAEYLDSNRMRVRIPGDYRQNEILYVFQNQNELRNMFKPYFSQIRTGKNRTDFFTRTLKHRLLTGVKTA